jgi:hypothetical protein
VHEAFMLALYFADARIIPNFITDEEPYITPKFQARGWGWTSPKDDVPAYALARKEKLMSTAQIIAETSGASIDVAELYDELADEDAIAESLKLPVNYGPTPIRQNNDSKTA